VDFCDIRTGKLIHSFLDHPGAVRSLSFSQDDRLLAVGCFRSTEEKKDHFEIWLWQAPRGPRKRVIRWDGVSQGRVALSPTGNLVAACGRYRFDSEIRLFETATGGELARSHLPGVGWTLGLMFSPDGKTVAVSYDSKVQLCRVRWPGGPSQRRKK
jgi:WD40 repeat protein